MQITNIPGIEERVFTLQTNIISGPKLLVDGQSAKPGEKKNHCLVTAKQGNQVEVVLKNAFPDSVPVLVVNGATYHFAKPLPWYDLLWCSLPMVLILVGGCVGGGMATFSNFQLFRSNLPTPLKYLGTLGLTVLCVGVWFAIMVMARSHIQPPAK